MQSLCLIIALLAVDPPQIFSATGIYAQPQQDQEVPASDEYYVVMFTASWCGPCQNVKKSGKLEQIRAAGYQVKLIDIDQDKKFYSGSIPKFWLCKNSRKVHEWVPGAVEPSAILAKIRELEWQKPAPSSSSNLFGRKGTSHESRQTLIDHMLEDGIHKGRHTRQQLEAMSDAELVELHDREHEKAEHSIKNGIWKP